MIKQLVHIGALLLAFIMIMQGCKDTTSANNPVPGRVVLVEKSPDSALVETGIDAENSENPNLNQNGIFLHWHPVNDDDLEAYDIYRKALDSTGTFNPIGVIRDDTTFLDMQVSTDTIYYYYVIARDEENQEGLPSKKEHYKLLAKPLILSPDNNQNFTGSFNWEFTGFVEQYFIIRIERRFTGEEYLPYYLALLETQNFDPSQMWDLSEVGLDSLATGDYRWRIDVRKFKDDRQGAESNWGVFRVP